MNTHHLLKAGGLTATLMALALSGCATSSDIDAIRTMAQQAMDTANSAAARADQASADAAAAQQQAGRAMQAAQQSQTCCAENSEKIERLLQRSMTK